MLLISTQVKDLLGLQIDNVPAEVLPKWNMYLHNLDKMSLSSVIISLFSFAVIFYIQKNKPKLPAYLISVVGATLIVAICGLDIETIGNKFGGIPHFLPMPQLPNFDWNLFFKVIPSGLTIAFLAGVESLLSATVVDGMSGDNHNSNAELIGEGVANLACVLFAGVPATGAIARTATNFKAHASSPIAGIMQSVFLLLFMLLLSPAAKYIPLACLSAVLIIVGWNMMNIEKIYKLAMGPRGDRYTLLTTLFLTVLVDLNTAISVGFIFVVGGANGMQFRLRMFITPALLATYLAILLVYFQVETPRPVASACNLIGSVTIPASLLIIGSSLADIPVLKMLGTPKLYVMCALKLVAVPALIYGILSLCPVEKKYADVIVVLCGMPVAAYGVMFCSKHGIDPTRMSQGTFLSTLFSLFSVPLLSILL